MRHPKDYIIFPLDVPSVGEAKKFITLLSDHVGMFKVGLELFIQAGPDIVRRIKNTGPAGVFLDLKLHDIPATVGRAMARAAELGVALATVHCGETKKMLEAAVEGGGGRVGVLGVTVLTSVSADDIRSAGFLAESVETLVMKRAQAAREAGCAGVVCSPLEVRTIKERFGDGFLAVTPGIRPSWETVKGDDQQRVATPASAVSAGADYLVIGRPIRDAENPAAAAKRVAEEIEAAVV